MNWLKTFDSVLHIAETAAKIAAPIISAYNPVIGSLVLQASSAVISAEFLFQSPGSGAQKAALVRAQTQVTVNVINDILKFQNKPLLDANIVDMITVATDTIVSGVNAVQQAISPATLIAK